jgi:hypothetical protein
MITIDNDFKVRLQYQWQEFKKQGYQNNKVYIKEIPPKGLGVFAKEDIKAGEVAEMCHTFTAEIPSKYIQDKGMSEYMLPGVINNEAHPSFAFGFGCIYNSSESESERNVEWMVIPESRLSAFVANRDIKKDEELLAWFGDGFYISRCKPNLENKLKQSFHKQIDSKLALVKLPNSNNNILQDRLTKSLDMQIVENNNCDMKLIIQNLNDNNLNNQIKEECIKYLKEIDDLRSIEILFT